MSFFLTLTLTLRKQLKQTILTRLAQALYILKTKDFEGIFRRIERRALD